MDHLVADQIIHDLLNELNDFFTRIHTAMMIISFAVFQLCMIKLLSKIYQEQEQENSSNYNRPSGTGSCKRGS